MRCALKVSGPGAANYTHSCSNDLHGAHGNRDAGDGDRPGCLRHQRAGSGTAHCLAGPPSRALPDREVDGKPDRGLPAGAGRGRSGAPGPGHESAELRRKSSCPAQFSRFVAEFAQVDEAQARASKLAWPIPYAVRLFPKATFDMRKLLAVHAHGIADAANNSMGQSTRDKAFTLSAELFLMQHTCHWFCRSRAVASARVLARHKTSYAQLLAAVSPRRAAPMAHSPGPSAAEPGWPAVRPVPGVSC